MNRLKIFLLVFLTFLVSKVFSINLKGEIYSNTPFTKYIGKFCFNYNGGIIEEKINWDYPNVDTAKLLLFSDSIENVIEKVKSLSCNSTVTPSYVFTKDSKHSKFYKVNGQEGRYWYLVFQNCEKYPSKLKYEISLSNDDSFNGFMSADHQSVPEARLCYISIGFLVLFLFIDISNKIKELNVLVKFYLVTVMILYLISITIFIIIWHCLVYDLPTSKKSLEFANWIHILSKNLILFLAIYVGQGWTKSICTKSKLRDAINIFLTVFNITLGWSLSYINDYSKPDIEPYKYYLDCLPGYFSYAAYGLLTINFIYSNIISYKSLKDHQLIEKLLMISTLVFSIYLLSPILVGIITHFVAVHFKYKFSTIINYTFDFLFYIIIILFITPIPEYFIIKKLLRTIDTVPVKTTVLN
ncbi:hypothetical protein ACTFIZ_008761 [Dictyostelium cf. discoideum]